MLGDIATYYDEEQKIWSGPKRKDYYGPDMTLGEVALHVLSTTPDKIVQVMDTTDEKLTAAELLRDAKAVARNLQLMGLKTGDVIGISANNTTNLTAVILGALLCGTPINAIYPEFGKESVVQIFKLTMPKLIFCDAKNYETVKAAEILLHFKVEIIIVHGEVEGVSNVKDWLKAPMGHSSLDNSFPCHNLTGDDTAFIICSSGTTGPPKGSCCSHKALLNQLIFPNIPTDAVVFSSSPMYWISAVWIFVMSIVSGAKRIITNLPVPVDYYLQLIEKHKITHAICGLSQIVEITQKVTPDTAARLDSIDTIIAGGSKVPKVVAEKMVALLGEEKLRVGLIVAYGMTELSGMLSKNIKGPGETLLGNEGKLTANKEVRILSKTSEPLGVNETGLISIRLRHKWPGYYRQPEATAKTYVDGWFLTSDIGYFDAEGNLTVCSRISDAFKSNRFQIHPEFIEEVVLQLPGVQEACIFGIPHLKLTNLIACAIVRMNNDDGHNITEDQIIAYVAGKLSAVYCITGGVYFVKELPKTSTGKLQRRIVWETIQKKNSN